MMTRGRESLLPSIDVTGFENDQPVIPASITVE